MKIEKIFSTFIMLSIIISACGSGLSGIEIETKTLQPTPTSTPIPLTAEEEAYIQTMNTIENKRNIGFYSVNTLSNDLHEIQVPDRFSETNKTILATMDSYVYATEIFSLAFQTYLLTAINYCDISSYNYQSCKMNQQKAQTAAQNAAGDADDAKAAFNQVWSAAIDERNQFLVDQGLSPIATATPFPLPPSNGLSALDETVESRYGTLITVQDINLDATQYVLDENSFNDEPAEGEKYIMLKVKVLNQTDEAIYANRSQFDIHVDDESYAYSSQTITDSFDGGELAAGESEEGYLVFILPASTDSDYILTYLEGELAWKIN